MDLAGNAWKERGAGEMGLKASCQPASAPGKLQASNLAGKACSVTGCRPRHCAMQPRRQSLLGHGLSPYKKAKKQIFLRERAPDEICFYLFCMACSFREKKCLHYGKRYGRLIFAVT